MASGATIDPSEAQLALLLSGASEGCRPAPRSGGATISRYSALPLLETTAQS